MPTLPQHLFVYGTLLPGLAPPIIADVVNALRIIGEATVRGKLYDLGEYPGCVLDAEGEWLIHGKLLEIPDSAVLNRLDWYECYAAHDEAGSLFVRTICEVTTAEGQKAVAWIYVYNRELSGVGPISDGRYRARK